MKLPLVKKKPEWLRRRHLREARRLFLKEYAEAEAAMFNDARQAIKRFMQDRDERLGIVPTNRPLVH